MGAGRAGRAVAAGLQAAGWSIGSVVTRRRESAADAVRILGGGEPAGMEADFRVEGVLLLGVPDDDLAETAEALARRCDLGGVVAALHLSGAHGRDVLAALADAAVPCGSLHPIRAIPASDPPPTLAGTWFGLEGDEEALQIARRLIADLEGKAFDVPAGGKPLYHAACTFASNAVVAAFDAALALMGRAGISREEAQAALGSMLREAAAEAARRGPEEALTGPVSRGDVETVRAHLSALDELPELRSFYRAFARHLVDLAGRGNEPREKGLAAVLGLLEEKT